MTTGSAPQAVEPPSVPCQVQLEDLLDRLNDCSPEISGVLTQGKLLSRLAGLRQARKAAAAFLKALESEERIAELEVFDYLENDDLKSVNHDLGRFVRVIMVQGTVSKEERDRFLEWAEDNGQLEAVTVTQIRKAALNELAKAVDKGEHDDVPGLGVFMTKQVRFTPAP